MRYISNIMHILSVLLLHFVCTFILQAKIGEGQIRFTSEMFPRLGNYTVINSSAIAVNWYPSANITGVDLTKLFGTLTMAGYAGSRSDERIISKIVPMTELNKTGQIVYGNLKADTIYRVILHREWRNGFDSVISGTEKRFLRTYPISK